MNKEISETDWMIMGMIHAYKILGKTKADMSLKADMNDVDYLYLVEMQRRNIESPSSISAEFPYVFLERNDSAHDQVHLGMMNVFKMLNEQKEKGQDLNELDSEYLVNSLTKEMENPDLIEAYDDVFVEVGRLDTDLEDLK